MLYTLAAVLFLLTLGMVSEGAAQPASSTGESSGCGSTSCFVLLTSSTTNGQCGPANGIYTKLAPKTGLCIAGTASAVGGTGPWTWTCAGSNGGAKASCEAYNSILPPDRDASANWHLAGMLSVGGIPNRTTTCATVSPLGGGRDDTNNIQNAIESCPLGQVVQLAAGTFTIAEGNYAQVDRGITLRGAGPGRTILQRTGGAVLDRETPGGNPSPVVIVGPMRYSNNFVSTNLATDAVVGGHSVSVKTAAGFSVGQIVLLDEQSDANWQKDPQGRGQIWAEPDFRVVWQKHKPSLPDIDDFSASETPQTPNSAGQWFSRLDRPTAEYHRISSISGNTITFDSPVTISYRAAHQAQLSYTQTPYVTNAGVENMTLRNGDDGQLRFEWAAMSWAKNVESTVWLGEGFAIDFSFRIQLEEFYVHDAAWAEPGGAGYAISLANGSSEVLIENGISIRANKVMVSRCSGAGSVTAYNYMDDGHINTDDTWIEIGLNNSHMTGSHHMLLEGNYGFNIDSDDTHGAAVYTTYFRNYAPGVRRSFVSSYDEKTINDIAQYHTNGPVRAAGAQAYSYWFSFVGNVLGMPGGGGIPGWVYAASNWTNGQPTIWQLGWDSFSPYPVDTNVANTAIRDGNFDYVTNLVAWASTDLVHTLPNSLYLTQAPTFFHAGKGYTWPWVSPTGSTKLYTLPAKARYDAGTPFTQP